MQNEMGFEPGKNAHISCADGKTGGARRRAEEERKEKQKTAYRQA
jgi:hypothetical protein